MTTKTTVIVETMPDHLRSSHRAAGNWGVYPLNGAERTRVEVSAAEEICAEDDGEYNHIVSDTEEDLA